LCNLDLVGDLELRMFDAMILKREMGKSCNVDVKILETMKDGLILRIMENIINKNSLVLITDFVNKHKLNMLFDNGVYFISNQLIAPSEPTFLSE
jgi:hypothetical protein